MYVYKYIALMMFMFFNNFVLYLCVCIALIMIMVFNDCTLGLCVFISRSMIELWIQTHPTYELLGFWPSLGGETGRQTVSISGMIGLRPQAHLWYKVC